MKKSYTFLLTFFTLLTLNAQDLAKKIPEKANIVITIKGKNVLDLVSLDEFSSSKIGAKIIKELSRESNGEMAGIRDLGLNLNQDFYYYLQTKEGVFYNVILIPFTDTKNITNLLLKEESDVVQEGGLSYTQSRYDGVVLMWNNNTMVFVVPSDQNKDYYDDYGIYDYEHYNPTAADVAEATDSVAEAMEETMDKIETIEDDGEVAIEFDYEETIQKTESVVVEETAEAVYDYYESDAYKKQEVAREKRRLEREVIRAEAKKILYEATLAYAKEVLTNNPKRNIFQNNAYKKSLGNGKDEAMFWINDFMGMYKNTLPKRLLGPANPYKFLNLDALYEGMTITGKLNFGDNQAIMDIDYSMNAELANAYKPMYNGKFNRNFLNYINEDKLLGYMSVNLSTKGILEAYPDLIEKMFIGKVGKTDDKTATISAATTSVSRLFSLLIDEEGAAKILRGDMLLLLTDLREKEVTYTDYEYDEDYNYKKIEKTKTETVPDFLFLFTSEEEKLFRNFMKIGVLEDKVGYEDDIYSVASSRSNPFDIYAMYYDNTVFVGSSREHLNQIKKGTYESKLSNQLKKDIIKSASSFYINGKNIVSKIPTEAFPRELRSDISFLTNNTEDLNVSFSRIKGNTMTGEMVLKTPKEGHKNSLMYFINIMEKLMD